MTTSTVPEPTAWAPPEGKPVAHPITVGVIFVNSWGYDQTNVDAYQVVAVTKASVKIRRIATASVEGSQGFMSCKVVPVADAFSERDPEVLTKRVRSYEWGGKTEWHLSMDYGSCSISEPGETHYCSWYA